jgi:hypothetical protein
MSIGSFFKGLGKGLLKVAPVAAAFIPGIGPIASMALSAGLGTANGAISGGKKGALIGGLMGAGTGALGNAVKAGSMSKMFSNGGPAAPAAGLGSKLASGALASGLPVSSPTVGGSAMGVPDIPTTSGFGGSLPTGFGGSGIPNIPTTTGLGGVPTSFGGNVPPSVNASDPSFLTKLFGSGSPTQDKLKEILGKLTSPNGLGSIGTAMGAISGTQAHNRGEALDAMMSGDRMRLAAAGNQRQEDAQNLRMLQATNYLKNGGMPKKELVSSSGMKIPDFGFGPAPITDETKSMASDMEKQLLDRMHNPLKLSDYDSKMNPSGTESTLDWLGPVLSGYSNVMNPSQTPQLPQSTTGQTTTGMGNTQAKLGR